MIALLLAFCCASVDLAEAERAYHGDHFDVAQTLFLAALEEEGVPAGEVRYDLGNCAYRRGEYAEAILWWRRAKLRLPEDEAITFNLRLAESKLGIDARDEEAESTGLAERIALLPPPLLLTTIAALQTIGLLGLVLLRGRRGWEVVHGLCLLVGIGLAGPLLHARWFPDSPEGVILGETVTLHSEPTDHAAVTAELSAGRVVVIEATRDEWRHVAHPEGRGWAKRAGIGVIE